MRLRTRLILAAAYIVTIAVIGLEIPLAITIAHSAKRDTEDALTANAVLVAARINDDLPNVFSTDPAVADPARAYVDEIVQTYRGGSRIVVVDALGRVASDSAGTATFGEVYATPSRPEFGKVLRSVTGQVDVQTRHSEEAGQVLLLVTAPVIHRRLVAGAVRFSEPLSSLNANIRRTWVGLGLIGLAAVLAGLAVAWLLAAGLSRPVHRLSDAAARLGHGDLAARAEVEGPREVAGLAETFNTMADQIGTNLQAQRDFLANASHQLRTPLTGLTLRLEAIEAAGGPTAEEARKAHAEVARLNELVEDLLSLARASSVQPAGERLDLAEEARDAADRWSGPAEGAGKELAVHADGPVPVWASPADLGHILDNLIENAIRYSPAAARITVEAAGSPGPPRLRVADTGSGIPPQDRARLFERFFRGSSGRAAGPGSGLGLAVVSQLAQRWGGEVHLADGPGTVFEVRFPPPPTVPLPSHERP